jgi:hypothetical protein
MSLKFCVQWTSWTKASGNWTNKHQNKKGLRNYDKVHASIQIIITFFL